MKKIAILSGKGGSGKTNLSVHLSVAAVENDLTPALIDLDPQASACFWKDLRLELHDTDSPAVVSAHAVRLPDILKTAEATGVDLVVMDTPPHAAPAAYPDTTALAAARTADLVLIPCKPAIFDLKAIQSTVDIIRFANVPALVVLNAVPARGTRGAEARDALLSYNLPCAPCHLGDRVAFVHAVTAGLTAQEAEPKSKASQEVFALYTYIQHHIGGSLS